MLALSFYVCSLEHQPHGDGDLSLSSSPLRPQHWKSFGTQEVLNTCSSLPSGIPSAVYPTTLNHHSSDNQRACFWPRVVLGAGAAAVTRAGKKLCPQGADIHFRTQILTRPMRRERSACWEEGSAVMENKEGGMGTESGEAGQGRPFGRKRSTQLHGRQGRVRHEEGKIK